MMVKLLRGDKDVERLLEHARKTAERLAYARLQKRARGMKYRDDFTAIVDVYMERRDAAAAINTTKLDVAKDRRVVDDETKAKYAGFTSVSAWKMASEHHQQDVKILESGAAKSSNAVWGESLLCVKPTALRVDHVFKFGDTKTYVIECLKCDTRWWCVAPSPSALSPMMVTCGWCEATASTVTLLAEYATRLAA